MKALGVDTEDDIYLLSNYFLKSPGVSERAEEGTEKGDKDEETAEEKEGEEEASGGVDEGEKKDDEGSVVFSVDEKASDSSSVKAHLSGSEAFVLIVVCTQPLSCFFNVHQIRTAQGFSSRVFSRAFYLPPALFYPVPGSSLSSWERGW